MPNLNKSPLFYLSTLSVYTTVFGAYDVLDSSLVGVVFAIMAIFINIENVKLRPIEHFFYIFLFLYIISFVLLSDNQVVVLQNSRYWFGLFLYILFFKAYSNFSIVSIQFFRLLCYSILLESLLINTIVDTSFLHGSGYHGNAGMFGIKRPLGFSGDPSTSSSIVISMLYLVEVYNNRKPSFLDTLLLLCAVIVSMSTTGVVVFMLYLVFRRRWNLVGLIKLFPILLVILYLLSTNDMRSMQYFSIEYFLHVMDYKLQQINFISDNVIIGNQLFSSTPTTAGDFGWLNMIETVGVIGCCIYLFGVYLLYGIDNKYLPVLILMFIATFHYPAAFQPAGQVIVAIIISLSMKYNYASLGNNKI